MFLVHGAKIGTFIEVNKGIILIQKGEKPILA